MGKALDENLAIAELLGEGQSVRVGYFFFWSS